MESTGYWARLISQRARRRSVLASGLALGLGAASLSLAGCGGSSDGQKASKFSFDRYASKGVNRTVLFNASSPEGPIASTEAPDAQTFVVKLSFPYAPLNSLLTFPRNIVVIPKEAEGGFDVRSEARGSGAW